jgi:NADPH-dependent ferric siderophore reductase
VRDLALRAGKQHSFLQGETDEIREVRRRLLADRGLGRKDISCSPYWRRTTPDRLVPNQARLRQCDGG